jgi:septal ring factor EnvC (AmiA/AmiB activator)
MINFCNISFRPLVMLSIMSGGLLCLSSCSQEKLKQSRNEQTRLEEAIEDLAQQTAEVQGKIDALEKANPRVEASRELSTKAERRLMAAENYLAAGLKAVEAKVQETQQKDAAFRAKYLVP